MSIAEKLNTIADNQPKVYDAGKKAEYDIFWDVFQNNGDSTSGVVYNNAFSYGKFNDINYSPKYPLYIRKGTTTADQMFYNATGITDIKVPMYCLCSRLSNTFSGCTNLKTIPYLELLATTTFTTAFASCSALENITVGGTIGQNGLSFAGSSKLTHESLMSIINALETKTSGTFTLTFGATNLAKLTDAEKAIATEKGWTLA